MSVKYFYHYTDFCSLVKILENNSLRFGNLNTFNDTVEAGKSTSNDELNFFAACTTYCKNESIPHWYIYTQLNYGVRIRLTTDIFTGSFYALHDGQKVYPTASIGSSERLSILCIEPNHSITVGSPKATRIKYKDSRYTYRDYVSPNPDLPGTHNIDIEGIVKTKGTAWSFEREFRYYTAALTRGFKLDAVYFELNQNFYDSLQIAFSPFMDSAAQSKYEKHLAALLRHRCPLDKNLFSSSSLRGKIQDKSKNLPNL